MGVEELLGKTLTKIDVVKGTHDDEITFSTDSGERYKLYHERDCCEHVNIEDVVGDIDDLIGSPLTMAEEATNNDNPKDEYDDSFTWTFYRFATVKGYVTIRWYGVSNGFYSESVNFEKVPA